jgi:glycosyltransferase involved in cell wall biosynthesis
MRRPRIVFYCGRSVEPWGPPKLNETGIGGSETAVVHTAQRFADDGWRCDVYNGAGKYEGVHGGVGYWEPSRLGAQERADVLVAWRQPAALDLPLDAQTRILWLHDHDAGPDAAGQLRRADRVLGVSAYHRDFLADAYDLPPGLVDFVPNGIDLARFAAPIKKVPQRCVYASSPDRGLLLLLKLWPRIVGDEQRPELHVGYGFDNIDKWINAGRHDLAEFKAECQRLIGDTRGVVYRGRMPQNELAKLYQESVCWLYPTDFLETSCISAMEAMAGGCIPVTSSAGALKETVGDGGLVVYGPSKTRSNPFSPAWQDFYVKCAQGVLFESNNRLTLAAMARERAKDFTWDASYTRWKKIVGRLLSEREELAA